MHEELLQLDGHYAKLWRHQSGGFLAPDESVSYGRPVGVATLPDGSLLVADDAADKIWRVSALAAK